MDVAVQANEWLMFEDGFAHGSRRISGSVELGASPELCSISDFDRKGVAELHRLTRRVGECLKDGGRIIVAASQCASRCQCAPASLLR